jgi:AraC family transcriptional regulator
MATTDGYGQRLGARLRAESASTIVTRALRNADMAVTEIRCDNSLPRVSAPIRREDAFLVALLLVDISDRAYWEDGRRMPVGDLKAGQICIYDLKRNPVVLLHRQHVLHFYLPRAALNAIADDADAPRIGDLNYKFGVGSNDAAISNLGSTVLPAVCRPEQANRLFVDHVMQAVAAHVAQSYGGMRPATRPLLGGLAPWQARRATEILTANLGGGVPLKDVAKECRLSTSHFSHAFRVTMGVAPHKWLLTRRVEVAKDKLRDSRLPLSDVALACGFADQSHLTRVFTRSVGLSPGAWRRMLED